MVLGEKMSRNTRPRRPRNNQRSTSTNKNLKGWTEADSIILRWTGRSMPEFKLEPETPADEQHPRQMQWILSSGPKYVNNPELVFGICRRLLTMNVFRQSNFENVMKYHPLWSQLWSYNEEDNENGTIKVEQFERDLKSFRIEAGGTETEDGNVTGGTVAVRDKNGKTVKRNILSAAEIKGAVYHQYIGEHGAKTESIKLGLTMVKYEGDSRPYIALNLGGGCAARYFLLKVGDKPDYEVNNDSAIKRKSFKDEDERLDYAERQASNRRRNESEETRRKPRRVAPRLNINEVRETVASGQTFGMAELDALLSRGGGIADLGMGKEIENQPTKARPKRFKKKAKYPENNR